MALPTYQIYSLPADLTVYRYRRVAMYRRILLAVAATFIALCLGVALGVFSDNPALVLAAFVPVALAPLLWFRPVWAVYVLVVGAASIETFNLHFPDSLTDRMPFFRSFSSLGGPIPLPMTPAELLMGTALLILMLQRMANRERPLEGGPLFWAIGCYALTVLFGFIYGVGTGGNITAALWEMRAQMYLFPVYLLVFNLVRTENQIKLVFWLFLGAVAIKGILGSWRYLVTLGGDLSKVAVLSDHNSLLAHEESLFFALFFVFILVIWLVRGDRSQLRFGLLLSPPVLLAFLANQRRAGTLAFLLGALVVTLLIYLLVQHRRRLIRSLAILGAAILPIYVVLLGGSNNLLAEPAVAIASMYQPDEKDEASNEYRVTENLNLQYNIMDSPILGRGYGKPIVWYIPLPDLSSIFGLWEFIPHNTLLWLWMRTGFLGFAIFWFMIGRFIVQASLVAKSQKDPYFLGIAIMSIATTLAWLAVGAVDQGLIDFRSTILLGTLMGLVSRISVRGLDQGPLSKPRERPEIISG